MTKRPSFQFYPADWRNDAALRMCSLAARGLWWEMLCIMHMAEPYGHLTAAGAAIEPDELARIVGEHPKDVRRWLAELDRRKVYSVTEAGVIYSRRMVRDEKERDNWRDRQAKSRAKQASVTPTVTPMSRRSSSSSSSSEEEEDTPSLRSGVREREPEGVEIDLSPPPFLDRRKSPKTPEETKASEPKQRRRKSPLPEAFPDAEAIMRAIRFFNENERPDLAHDVRNQAELFRAHHEAQATLSANWAASWRTWIGRAPGFTSKEKLHANGHSRPSAHDRFLAGGAAYIAKLEAAERESEGDMRDAGPIGPALLPGGLRGGTG